MNQLQILRIIPITEFRNDVMFFFTCCRTAVYVIMHSTYTARFQSRVRYFKTFVFRQNWLKNELLLLQLEVESEREKSATEIRF